MENILDILPVGVFVLDNNFHVAEVNSALETFFGLARADIIGRDKRKLVAERICHIFENGEAFRKRVLATYDDNTYIERFICHVLPNNDLQERWLEHSSQPIRRGSYQGGRIEVYTDVTDRILAEQEIHWLSLQTMQLVEKEKSRIASNLHDGLGQTILAIKFSLENIRESLKKQPEKFKREAVDLNKTIIWIENMGREVSSISSNLMPSMLGPLGLEETLTWLMEQYASFYGLDIRFQSYGLGDERLPSDLEVAIFRVFQESLNNIIKHASAKHVELKLIYSHPKIIATITDDGIGFNPENKVALGTGLRIMKQRILELNGNIKITSEIQQGTTIRAELPIQDYHHEKI
ncbi:MAG: PAS domain-containing sensor histidine kinase [Bellilinea sp.]